MKSDDKKACSRGHVGDFAPDGRCRECRRQSRRGEAKPIKRAAIHTGKACKKCGTTEKYDSNRACVHCSSAANRDREPEVRTDYPTTTVMVRRHARLPLRLVIPAPVMPPVLTRPWSEVA